MCPDSTNVYKAVSEWSCKLMALFSREESVTCLGENIVFIAFISLGNFVRK